ncbi:MAG: DUF2799 domain-containing protein, partial [Pseudomonadota bacterium]
RLLRKPWCDRRCAAGYASQSRIAGHTKACAKVDIKPDQLAWRAGYDRGLLRYCTPQNGLFVGQKGQTYNNVCPADMASDFIAAYSVGKRAYDAESELDSLKQDIESKQDEVSELLKDFAGMNQKDQLAAQFEIAELNAEIQRLQADVVQLSTDVARTKSEAEAYRQKLLSGS